MKMDNKETKKIVIYAKNLVKVFRTPVEEEKKRLKKLFGFLFRKYKEIKAVKGISFKIKEGEIVGYLGPNGAGKTTTIKMLIGLLWPTEGEVFVLGKSPFKERKEVLKQVGIVFGQKGTLIWELPVIDSLKLLKVVYDLDDKFFEERLNYLTNFFEAKDLLQKQYRTLSLGQRMKVELIAALLHKPKVLFLDEPTIGLDVYNKLKMREFLKKINKEEGVTILITTHDMDDIEELCERIILIDEGKKVYDGDLKGFKEKYANWKRIEIIYSKIKDKKLEEIINKEFEIIEKNEFKLVVKYRKEKELIELLNELFKAYEVEDLKIEDPKLENILVEFYKKGEKDD